MYFYKRDHMPSEALKARQREREAMPQDNGNSIGPQLMFSGTYTENGETKPTTYNFIISLTGWITGQARDDDGVAECNGKLNWPAGEQQGHIAWLERPSGRKIEVAGRISYDNVSNHLAINADYDSSYRRTKGCVNLTCATSGFVAPASATVTEVATPGVVVVPGTVVGHGGQREDETEHFLEK